MTDGFGPFVGNTHTETTVTGSTMTVAFHDSLEIIKNHVHASKDDFIIACESGMTGVVNKFQRILGLKIHEKFKDQIEIPVDDRPVVFITHMEHHSNHTSWLETIVTLEIIQENEEGLPDLKDLERLLKKYASRKVKIASVSACYNVTGVIVPYHEIAKIMHDHDGHCSIKTDLGGRARLARPARRGADAARKRAWRTRSALAQAATRRKVACSAQ